MECQVKVSIITVCLNSEKTIEQTIRSVLGQTYKEIEYIIVDGQSTDGTLDVIDKYRNQVAKIISEPDEGLYYAMNKGISMSTGDIIGILNSDDWYEMDAVDNIVDAFKDLEADIVYGKAKMLYNEQDGYLTSKVALEQMLYGAAIMHPTVFVKKCIYNQCGVFDTTYKIAADYELLIRLYMSKIKISYTDKHIVNFRFGGKSGVEFAKGVREVKNISLKYAQKYDGKEDVFELIEKRYKETLFSMALQVPITAIGDYFKEKFSVGKEGIYIWGAGYWGKEFYRVLDVFKLPVNGFIDNNYEEIDKYKNVSIYSPQILEDGEYNIFVAVNNYSDEIVAQLMTYNNSNIKYSTMEELKKVIYNIYNQGE